MTKPVSVLRQRMINDMKIRNMAPNKPGRRKEADNLERM